jgi:hypothetical protein
MLISHVAQMESKAGGKIFNYVTTEVPTSGPNKVREPLLFIVRLVPPWHVLGVRGAAVHPDT